MGHFHEHSTAEQEARMSKILRGLVAGYGAKKMGGCGCTGLLLFILLWWLLGHSGIRLFQ
jgi:hypothetical protein